MKRLYHLHIPRTSGMGICHALWKTFYDNGIVDVYSPNTHESHLMYDDEQMRDFPFISGHFAKNPIVYSDDGFDVFSIVRDPVEHFMSIAAYASVGTGMDMSNEYLDEFIYGNITPFGVNELFSNSGNIQSKMLFCRIAFVDRSLVSLSNDDVRNEKNIVFIENDMPSEDEIKELIKSINLFSLANRLEAIGWLEENLKKSHGFSLDKSIYKTVNCSKKNEFKPDKSHIKEIKSRSEIDEYLYRLVRER